MFDLVVFLYKNIISQGLEGLGVYTLIYQCGDTDHEIFLEGLRPNTIVGGDSSVSGKS